MCGAGAPGVAGGRGGEGGAPLVSEHLLVWPRGCFQQEGDCDKEKQVITNTKGSVGGRGGVPPDAR